MEGNGATVLGDTDVEKIVGDGSATVTPEHLKRVAIYVFLQF